MKKAYKAPRMELCKFAAEDILSVSKLFNFVANFDNEKSWLQEWNR